MNCRKIERDFFDRNNGHWNDQHRPAKLGIETTDALENKEFVRTLKACMNKLPAFWVSVFSMEHIDEVTTEVIQLQVLVLQLHYKEDN